MLAVGAHWVDGCRCWVAGAACGVFPACFSLPLSRMLFIALHHYGPHAHAQEVSALTRQLKLDAIAAKRAAVEAKLLSARQRRAVLAQVRAACGREGVARLRACTIGRGMGEARMQGPHGLRWLCPSRINRVHTLPLPCWKRGLNSTAPHCPASISLPADASSTVATCVRTPYPAPPPSHTCGVSGPCERQAPGIRVRSPSPLPRPTPAHADLARRPPSPHWPPLLPLGLAGLHLLRRPAILPV